MDVHAARGDESMLRRVVVLLVALAVLAERAAVRSPWVRCFVLWILRRAETVVGEFVLDVTGSPLAPEGPAASADGPADALRLALRFRALAAALGALLPASCPLGRRPARRGFAVGHAAPLSRHCPGDWTRKPNDTS